MSLYTIRPAKDTDINFIMATWLRGLYYGDSWFSSIPKHIFMSNYKKLAKNLIESKYIDVHVACLPDDLDTIIGYSVVTKNSEAVVWVFVKTAFRRLGVAKSLIPKEPKYVTHLTALGKTLMSKLPRTEFNPFY